MKFIATCPPGREGEAILELEWGIEAKVRRTRWGGVLIGETELNKEEVFKRLQSFETFALQKIIPIDLFIPLEKLNDVIGEIATKIPKGKSFAVRAKVRGAKIGEKSLEIEIGGLIKRITGNPVNLENPEYLLIIEVLGKKAGVALIKPDDIIKLEVKP
ncbi:THUMP domain-containing protein [Pyrococcus horikoshii]|uniref:THUMP domain-containing protein n=2 Tax=Pyrococcus horikoshii TaxID=53953 RepID=O57838_PYRHO|nr:THUMP domain-containing protein [Pyrococcus horikoshii]BAA29153.1 158aa long hypothetical protein [Pyrococcus horikoshii OT3]HII61556.1 RNA-binding protein [Pyrococcus horikoshii]